MRLGRTARVPEALPEGTVTLECLGIDAELGGTRILHGVDFCVRAGELVALVGPNGAGKSTLFSVLSGDLAATSGTVRLDGLPLGEWSMIERAQRRSVLPQQVTVSFPFLVRDVVRMGRSPWIGTPQDAADDEIVARSLNEAGITGLAGRRFTSLSGGERARVTFARLLAQDCQVILLDEPTASLDIHHQELLLGTLRARVNGGSSAVIVLHDLALAAAFADRVAVMADGRIVGDGPPREVFTEELLSRVYGHGIEVVPHPRTGELLVVPHRGR